MPPLPQLARAWRLAGARQLFSGGSGSGAAFHFHNAAYNVLFFGTKHWLLTPPRYAGVSGIKTTEWEQQHAPKQLPAGLPLRCTQGPGDMLLLPPLWGHTGRWKRSPPPSTRAKDQEPVRFATRHATKNLGFNIGIGDLFCDARTANQSHDPQCRMPYRRLRCDGLNARNCLGYAGAPHGKSSLYHGRWAPLVLAAKGKDWVDPEHAPYAHMYSGGGRAALGVPRRRWGRARAADKAPVHS